MGPNTYRVHGETGFLQRAAQCDGSIIGVEVEKLCHLVDLHKVIPDGILQIKHR